MTMILRLLAAALLATPALATAAPVKRPAAAPAKQRGARAPKPPIAAATAPAEPPALIPSAGVTQVAQWVTAAGDNHGLPYLIVDKTQAALFMFDGKGVPLAREAVLIGIAPGDDATAGVGSKKLAEIGPAEKTTPAGRYLARFGVPFRGERILWVDYATSVALHPIPSDASKREHRRDRMLSPTPDDNRITFGCINVPKAFYAKLLRPRFAKKGGYVYVLPDTKPIEEVFPRLRVQQVIDANAAISPERGS